MVTFPAHLAKGVSVRFISWKVRFSLSILNSLEVKSPSSTFWEREHLLRYLEFCKEDLSLPPYLIYLILSNQSIYPLIIIIYPLVPLYHYGPIGIYLMLGVMIQYYVFILLLQMFQLYHWGPFQAPVSLWHSPILLSLECVFTFWSYRKLQAPLFPDPTLRSGNWVCLFLLRCHCF